MSKKKKRITPNRKNKEFVVVKKNPEDYTPFDIRSHKPICYKKDPLNFDTGSMVLQELEEYEFSIRINGKRNILQYYAPNNVGLLLSISHKSIHKAKLLFADHLNPDKINHMDNMEGLGKNETVIKKSKIIYDFIEEMQIAIVFGFTALEAFVNLSIPDDYEYKTLPNNKGVIEIYNKESIERWTSLQTKLAEILVEIYETTDIKKTKLWNKFLEFEKMRNEIIHQKSIDDTDFYKKYLKTATFDLCECPTKIITFFYEALESKNRTNPLWPWVIDRDISIPVTYKFNSSNFNIIGNIYEGKR